MKIEEQPNGKLIKLHPAPVDEIKALREIVRKQRQRIRNLELENNLLWAGMKNEGTLQ